MTTLTTREAIGLVLAEEMTRDPKVVYLGETIRDIGATGASRGLFDQFGPARIIETPVSENGFFGAALGLALSGFSPVIEIYSADFALIVANEIINDFPKWRQQQRHYGPLPVTIRGWMGASGGLGPEHSQCMEAYFHHAPGLTVIAPGTMTDMAGLLRSAIRSSDPVLFLEHRRIYEMSGVYPANADYCIEIGCGEIIRDGIDITMVAWSHMRHVALEAAQNLENESISVEVIDPKTIKPMDYSLIAASVEKTGRLIVIEESPLTGSIGGEIVARMVEGVDRGMVATRVAMPDMIHPYSASMEKQILPDSDLVIKASKKLINSRAIGAITKNPFL
jgi:pyruvate/2-oxoglutarate/acetoin dehydrogenase E1 component